MCGSSADRRGRGAPRTSWARLDMRREGPRIRNLTASIVACLALGGTPEARGQGVDTVRVGHPALHAARLGPGTETVDSYVIDAGVRKTTALTRRTIALDSIQGEPAYRIRTVHGTPDGDSSISIMIVRAHDLSLTHHDVRAPRDSMSVTLSGVHLTGWVVLPDTPARLLDRTLPGAVFAVDGQLLQLLALGVLGLQHISEPRRRIDPRRRTTRSLVLREPRRAPIGGDQGRLPPSHLWAGSG